jgi:hypothetical protein
MKSILSNLVKNYAKVNESFIFVQIRKSITDYRKNTIGYKKENKPGTVFHA